MQRRLHRQRESGLFTALILGGATACARARAGVFGIITTPGADPAMLARLWRTAMPMLNVNGRPREHRAEADTPLLWVLREQLGLTGTKYGCGAGQCGACTVHIDGVPTRSCVRPVGSVSATEEVVTIEGLSGGVTHPIQRAWAALDVPQCGFCQSGMIMAAAALIKSTPKPTDADIDAAMTNICRCGTYNRVRAAIKQATGSAA